MLLKRILILLMLPATYALAQDLTSAKANMSLKFINKLEIFAGPSVIGIHGNADYEKYGVTKIGYIGGVGITHMLNKRLDLNFKISYERKGNKQRAYAMYPPDIYNDPSTTVLPPVKTILDGDLNNSYLTFLLLPKFRFGTKNKIYFGTGAYYGKLVKSQVTRTDTQNGQTKLKTTLDQSDTYKDFDYGVSSCLGYYFLDNKNFILGSHLLFSYGLINIVNLQPGLAPMKNNSLSLLISLSFK